MFKFLQKGCRVFNAIGISIQIQNPLKTAVDQRLKLLLPPAQNASRGMANGIGNGVDDFNVRNSLKLAPIEWFMFSAVPYLDWQVRTGFSQHAAANYQMLLELAATNHDKPFALAPFRQRCLQCQFLDLNQVF